MKMLKQRLLTALIMIPIVAALVIYLSPRSFCAFTALFVLWGAWEWSAFLGMDTLPKRFIYPVVMVFILLAAFFVRIPYALYASLVWWILVTILVICYPKGSRFWMQYKFVRAVMGVLVLVPCWMALNFIRSAENGTYMILFLFVLVWVADSAAYFVGRKWGKHKLAPQVSPGKSWEGLAGALIAALLVAMLQLTCFSVAYEIWPAALLLSLATVLFSIVGDLFESMMKRNANLKDAGQSLPGHGGILDRIDSLTAAAPIFTLGAVWVWELYRQ
jgi:phosphatidate cytidylyltransferase